ncbi:MAG: hypothetical protein WA825_19615 [Steroidobacteraceae bacterium]
MAVKITRLALLTGSLVVAAVAQAGKTPDLNGIWVFADSFMDRQDGVFLAAPGRAEASERENKLFSMGVPKLKGEYAKRAVERQIAEKEAEAQGKTLGDPAADCIPPGMPGFWMGPYAFEILQNATQINFFQESWEQTRRIYLDGRKHPSLDDVDPLYQGHSVGHWEGDTLVVDTVNISPATTLGGAPHSDKLSVSERFHLVKPDILDIRVTIVDPDALAEPWVITRKLRRKPGMEIHDYVCAENNRNHSDENGATQTILKSR